MSSAGTVRRAEMTPELDLNITQVRKKKKGPKPLFLGREPPTLLQPPGEPKMPRGSLKPKL
jgi:hypothetical protein